MPAQQPVATQAITDAAERLTAGVLIAVGAASNEANLRHEVERLLQQECHVLGIPYIPFQLERALRGDRRQIAFADVVHGGIIIEYEPPNSFSAGQARANIQHAKSQAEDYAARMAHDEGRPIDDYMLIIWDGAYISFGVTDGEAAQWDRIVAFDVRQAERLLFLLRDQGRPLVHPALVRTMVGPESQVGARLIPVLFRAVVVASTSSAIGQSKTTLLFKEWSRLFGQAVGIPTDRLEAFLVRQSHAHCQAYDTDIPCYLFALHTYIATVAKLVSALALPRPSQDIRDTSVELRERMQTLEIGTLFEDAGITNMLTGDFFSWPIDDQAWSDIEPPLGDLLAHLSHLSFDMTRRNPESVRDLFKGIYEEFVPRELRHALGEVYTPDWLAGHALDEMGWQPANDLLDPTCGTGTFILEAVRRRLVAENNNGEQHTAHEILHGLFGMDLNPLAVLAAKASLIVVLANRLDPAAPVRLPIFLADAINTAAPTTDGYFSHRLQTERGVKEFKIPADLAQSPRVHEFFDVLRTSILENQEAAAILPEIRCFLMGIGEEGEAVVAETINVLIDLHREQWDGIWCPILADRFAAGAIPKLSNIAGNPPWVKWSHLPRAYAEFIKPQCLAINVFSQDRYVGGIESDISTIITFQAIRKWLAPNGRLAFFITATVFSNESSQGFRRFAYPDGTPMCRVLAVEDFKALKAFEGVTNHPALLIIVEGQRTVFPVPYRIWSPPLAETSFRSGADFRARARRTDLVAEPVRGTDAGPWLKGYVEDQMVWRTLFDAATPSVYLARKGVTTDRNGIFFLRVGQPRVGSNNLVPVSNDPDIGRIQGIPVVSMEIETTHIFPLMRGRGLSAFQAKLDPDYRILLPQRGMHGDPALLRNCPKTRRFLMRFRNELEQRASYRKFQREKPYWSMWSTGPYTFSPYKVLWKEMSGRRFCAAYIGETDDPVLGRKVVIPDHKLYMVPVGTLEEAQFLTGILNAPTIARAIAAYAAQLSLGTSVIEYLKIPEFNLQDVSHTAIVSLAGGITARDGEFTDGEIQELDRLAVAVVSAHR